MTFPPRLAPASAVAVAASLAGCGGGNDAGATRGLRAAPSLRYVHVATCKAFFHNGAFGNLADVVRFYVRRDTNPEQWYPIGADGVVQKFNDVPAQYRANVNTTDAPFNRKPGMAPALDEAAIADLVRFLGTLTDGYAQ